ncbi:MAG: NusG domain II-containing protein [Clostridiales bacterium]|nr:NusG domain II-containing protein [Clostridiales bacterium]
MVNDKKIGRKEIILLAVIFAVLLMVLLIFVLRDRDSGNVVRVTVDGETFGDYDLTEDQEIEIVSGGKVTNTLVIEDGEADMIEADCPDQICVNMSPISAEKETIICLPNKIVVEVISSDEEADFDAIVQ